MTINHTLTTQPSGAATPSVPTLAQETGALIGHLGHVLNLQATDRVLLIPGEVPAAGLRLLQDIGCDLTVVVPAGAADLTSDPHLHIEAGALPALPFADASFDAVIVAAPLTSGVQHSANELARLVAHSGRLGMLLWSAYPDQLAEDAAPAPVMQARPAAAYRAVLGEAGFTAFLVEDRRRTVRKTAAAYRALGLEATPDTTLELLATGGLTVTLLTAEKGL